MRSLTPDAPHREVVRGIAHRLDRTLRAGGSADAEHVVNYALRAGMSTASHVRVIEPGMVHSDSRDRRSAR